MASKEIILSSPLNSFRNLQCNHQFSQVVIGTGKLLCIVGTFLEDIAGFQEIIQFQSVECAHGFHARKFHLHRQAAFFLPLLHQSSSFPVKGIRRPRPAFDIRNADLIKDGSQFLTVPDRQIIRRRRIIVGSAVSPVAFCGNDKSPEGFLPVQAAAGSEYDKLCRPGQPVGFKAETGRGSRADAGEIESDLLALCHHSCH